MTEAQRELECKAYIGDCQGHLRNIIINGMALKWTEALQISLEDDLAELSSFARMSVDGMQLIRAAYKEFNKGGAYAKGKQREFLAWLKKHHPSTLWLPIERAEGGRQDLTFDAAVPLFINRMLLVEFLRGLLVPGAKNTLEEFLYTTLRCSEMVALLRVCAHSGTSCYRARSASSTAPLARISQVRQHRREAAQIQGVARGADGEGDEGARRHATRSL